MIVQAAVQSFARIQCLVQQQRSLASVEGGGGGQGGLFGDGC